MNLLHEETSCLQIYIFHCLNIEVFFLSFEMIATNFSQYVVPVFPTLEFLGVIIQCHA